MATTADSITVREEQVLYFRARRGHLAGPGAANPVAAARAILGAQAQQLPPALLALSLRTKGRPTAAALSGQLFETPRRLVRTWGQRDTLHLYDPASDWAAVVAARGQWAPGGRGGPMPTAAAMAKALAVMESVPEPVTRSDLHRVPPESFVRALEKRAAAAGMDPRRLAATRLVWRLAQEGYTCLADNIGNERRYATRSAWFPKLSWPATPTPSLRAASDLARRYLAVYGPATAADVAHFFGARVANTRQWLARIERELTPVCCGDRKGLVVLTDDVALLKKKPPSTVTGWPLRLLPLWESMLMAHADKSWTVPDEAERTIVWRKAAFVAAVVIARGRIVATWSYSKRRGRLAVEVEPMSRWSATKHTAGVRREARAVAAHRGLDGANVTIAK